MNILDLKPNHIARGSILPEPIKIITTVPMGSSVKLIGEGLNSGKVHQPVLTLEQMAELELSPEKPPFDGDPANFRLGIEAMRLGLAYEYDPYFSLSIARVDPLPHQLEAVYDYFLKLPRIRFLLADDPGAGKTIMAGLLIKELKVRGLIQRILIVTPANLSFKPGRGPEPEPHTATRLKWVGEVTPQKWTNLYMKVLSKLVSVGDVKLQVQIEAVPKDGLTDQQVEEMKAALRGLGLSDEVEKE